MQFQEDGSFDSNDLLYSSIDQGFASAIVPPGLVVRVYDSGSDFATLYGDVKEPYTCQSFGAITGQSDTIEIEVPESPDSVPASTPDVEFYMLPNCEGPVFTHAIPEGSFEEQLSINDLDMYAGSIRSLRVGDGIIVDFVGRLSYFGQNDGGSLCQAVTAELSG